MVLIVPTPLIQIDHTLNPQRNIQNINHQPRPTNLLVFILF